MKTYDIAKEYEALNELLNTVEFDEETGEEIDNSAELISLTQELKGELYEKLNNIEYLKRDRKDTIDGLSIEIKRLQDRKKMFEREVLKLSDLQNFLLHGENLKTDKFTFYYRKSESVAVTDENAISEQYMKVEFKVDKTALKKALKSGESIDGAILEEKTTLAIR